MPVDFRFMSRRVRSIGLVLFSLAGFFEGTRPGRADGLADNSVSKVRRIPPAGTAIADADRSELRQETDRLGAAVETLRASLTKKPALLQLLPDVEVYHKAVDWALRYDEFFRTNEVTAARELLRTGLARAASLEQGQAPWTSQTGLVVRGYRSRIDDSVQPFGLVIPAGYTPPNGNRYRLDCWFHGRGEQLTELAFVTDRSRNPGEFTPANAFVLHLYGRYCNGSRFAGETDFWEALQATRQSYSIDLDRISVRGFSLGGAACWHMTTHHASRWAAAAPGAGFSETAEFLKVFQQEDVRPAWWEQKLWNLYDSTSHALNTAMVPLVAYSGEIDGQRQAAQAMEKAMAAEGLSLTHLIGPKTGHQYEPTTKAELNRRIDQIVERGRVTVPREVLFVTHSLRYNQMAWVTVDALGAHWEPARVHASLDVGENRIRIDTTNVAALTLNFEPGSAPFSPIQPVTVVMNGQSIVGPRAASDRSWTFSVSSDQGRWQSGAFPASLRKKHGLQGPIDDAFMDSFLMVLPTGEAASPAVAQWAKDEASHAVEHWRRQFRGIARQKADRDVTDADIRDHHLVLWGDPQSNQLLARIADRLPIHWTADNVVVGSKSYPRANHAPVLVYPNPLNPERYIVINSGFTYREYDYLNNARQTPKLPDWAVLDIRTPPDARSPGKVVDAGFFGEAWELK